MTDTEKDKLLESNYDGIEEYDNDLPRWWLNIFWLTGIFSVVYVLYVHLGFATTDAEKIKQEISALKSLRASVKQAAGSDGIVTEESLSLLVADAEVVAKGKEVYLAKCMACHGQVGEGLIGPNLTDDFWIYGGSLLDIREIINVGVLEKGMLAWQGVIPDEEVNAVVAYIRSIRGTNPPNAKEPQGEEFIP